MLISEWAFLIAFGLTLLIAMVIAGRVIWELHQMQCKVCKRNKQFCICGLKKVKHE